MNDSPRESWLRDPDPDKYAEAMMKCQHPAGFCSADGFCNYRRMGMGSCFARPSRKSLEERVARLERKVAELEKAP